MAGFGFDAMVAQKTNQMKDKGRKGISLYLQALGVSFFKYKTFRTKIVIDDQEINDFIFLASIGIGKFNGGGMMLAPDADPTNGILFWENVNKNPDKSVEYLRIHPTDAARVKRLNDMFQDVIQYFRYD